MLDEQALDEARRVSGQKTISATVNLALRELARHARAGRILELRGSGLWEGSLAEMRGDAAAPEAADEAP